MLYRCGTRNMIMTTILKTKKKESLLSFSSFMFLYECTTLYFFTFLVFYLNTFSFISFLTTQIIRNIDYNDFFHFLLFTLFSTIRFFTLNYSNTKTQQLSYKLYIIIFNRLTYIHIVHHIFSFILLHNFFHFIYNYLFNRNIIIKKRKKAQIRNKKLLNTKINEEKKGGKSYYR